MRNLPRRHRAQPHVRIVIRAILAFACLTTAQLLPLAAVPLLWIPVIGVNLFLLYGMATATRDLIRASRLSVDELVEAPSDHIELVIEPVRYQPARTASHRPSSRAPERIAVHSG